MWEVTKGFRFEAAHSLTNTALGPMTEEVHGHSYRAEITVRGSPDPATGMVIDFGLFAARLEAVRQRLDHRLLDRIDALGRPTMENLARFIWNEVQPIGNVAKVAVFRDSCGESCLYTGVEE